MGKLQSEYVILKNDKQAEIDFAELQDEKKVSCDICGKK